MFTARGTLTVLGIIAQLKTDQILHVEFPFFHMNYVQKIHVQPSDFKRFNTVGFHVYIHPGIEMHVW